MRYLHPILLALALAMTILAPATAADWAVQGSFEPDTRQDRADGFMWHDAPVQLEGERIYFNAIVQPAHAGVNPNVGLFQSRVLVPGMQAPIAYLGVWKDCDRDGYMGAFETALLVYRAELLRDASLCPVGSLHNGGEWVEELLWIGPPDNAANPFGVAANLLADSDALVWGDQGRPGEHAQEGCYLNPRTGTFSSTGAMLAHVDCYASRGGADAVNEVDRVLGLGIGFEDPSTPQCSRSPLNQPLHLFGREPRCPYARPGYLERGSDREALSVWDCSRWSTVSDPRGGEPLLEPSEPGSVNVDPEGSVYDSMLHLEGGLGRECHGAGGMNRVDAYYDLINPEDSVAAAGVKRENTFAFEFAHDREGSFTNRLDPSVRPPPLFGIGLISGSGGDRATPGWFSRTSASAAPPLVRDDLKLEGPLHYTFYAYVGSDILSRGYQLPGSAGTYGAEWCTSGISVGSGIQNGVDCDPTHWYDMRYGASAMPTSYWSSRPLGALLGQIYQLRDVDCYDGNVLFPVQLGLSSISEAGPCPVEWFGGLDD